MTNQLDRGAAWLKGQREQHMSTDLAYLRVDGGHVATVETGTPGRKVFRLTNEYGASIRIETRDFLIGADQLPDDPEPGDIIEMGDQEYEVTSPGGEPCWQWSDAFRRTRRIHTTYIGNDT